ncbi:hypothetical protein [Ornithinimicrobium kibberense]|uniref:hypothetical protein n=1 Tax=Ornithinimicrobium kibberense TaxID=282060 RepID=UPI003619059F
MPSGAGPPQRRHAVDRRVLEIVPIRIEQRPDPFLDRVEIRHGSSIEVAATTRGRDGPGERRTVRRSPAGVSPANTNVSVLHRDDALIGTSPSDHLPFNIS